MSIAVKTDFSTDPSVPSGFDEEEEGLHPTHARVGASTSGIRTQVWTATEENWSDWPRDEFICCASEIGANINPSVAVLADLSNAFMRGETCRTFRVKTPDEHGHDRAADKRPEQFILNRGSVTAAFRWLDEALREGDFTEGKYEEKLEVQEDGVRFVVYREEPKGVRTFSAAHLDQITPLSSVPKSWNVRRVMRAVLAGQVEQWHVDGVYTDDYALDDALNFRRGELEDYLQKARRIWERPSGWDVWVDRDDDGSRTTLSFNCHLFDTNTLNIDLSAGALDIDWFTCLRKNKRHPADER